MIWLLLVIRAKLILNVAMKSSGTSINDPSAFCAFLVLFFGAIGAFADTQSTWPRWRGPQDNGSTENGSYPISWDTNKVLWKVPLPGKGCSTPAIWNDHIYLTAPADGQDSVLAYDWAGKRLWQTTFGQENAGKHRNGSGSNPSPATDGKSVFVYFKSGTFAALNLGGKIRWQTNLVQAFGPDTLYWDHGISPVLSERYAIVVRMHHGESWLAAFDKTTGELRWKVPRNYDTPVEGDHGYSTPLLLHRNGREELVVWGGQHLTVHDVSNGKVVWSFGDAFNPESKPNWPSVASIVVAGDIAVVPFGRADRGQPRLHGIRIADQPAANAKSGRLWERDDTGTFVPTPALYMGRVYIVRDRGEVECIDPATGKSLWSNAFPKASSSFYSSPVVASGKLYAAREDGVVFVANVDGKFELLSENNMGERVIASPVPVANRLFIRGEQHLFCIAGEK
jgi:outer membrane protein assembly factor BamB